METNRKLCSPVGSYCNRSVTITHDHDVFWNANVLHYFVAILHHQFAVSQLLLVIFSAFICLFLLIQIDQARTNEKIQSTNPHVFAEAPDAVLDHFCGPFRGRDHFRGSSGLAVQHAHCCADAWYYLHLDSSRVRHIFLCDWAQTCSRAETNCEEIHGF